MEKKGNYTFKYSVGIAFLSIRLPPGHPSSHGGSPGRLTRRHSTMSQN